MPETDGPLALAEDIEVVGPVDVGAREVPVDVSDRLGVVWHDTQVIRGKAEEGVNLVAGITCFCVAEAGEDVQDGRFLSAAHFPHHRPLVFEDLGMGEDFGGLPFVDAMAERRMEGISYGAAVEEAGHHVPGHRLVAEDEEGGGRAGYFLHYPDALPEGRFQEHSSERFETLLHATSTGFRAASICYSVRIVTDDRTR